MTDRECTEFLQWCLPRLRLRWAGFRKVRRQICKRLTRRLCELGLPHAAAYRTYLSSHPNEWKTLDTLCRITISRFYRDRGVFDTIGRKILPTLAEKALTDKEPQIRCWSAGCGSGEEPYTIHMIWRLRVAPKLDSDLPIRITATDTSRILLDRASNARYTGSSIKDLPTKLRDAGFVKSGDGYTVRENFKENIEFLEQDIRSESPDGTFHLVLCRNLVFTYFEPTLQSEVLERIVRKLVPGGFLIAGIHEKIPGGIADLVPHEKTPGIYRLESDNVSKKGGGSSGYASPPAHPGDVDG
ncbi:MAG: methyltransferase domain-containing protein [Candidatus Latescibacterota bacterium]|nr:MAG: methyltransferase domain-containing protein [Candidatus Latescibacterota bacterium]